jgi:protein TonB
MTAVIVIIALVAFISLLDYGLFQRWQMSTSPVRNEVVFEKRNREYGAYAIRNEYDRNLFRIMVFLIALFSSIFGLYSFFRTMPVEMLYPSLQTNSTILTSAVEPKQALPEKQNQQQKQTSSQANSTNTEPIVQDKQVVQQITLIDSSSVGTGKPGIGDAFGNGKEQGGGQAGTGTGSGTGTGTGTGTGLPSGTLEKPPVDIVDVEAQFPGGYLRMMEYIQGHLVYPQIGIEIGAQGKCYVKFVVDENGTISNVKVVRGVPNCPECDKEAIRVVKSMPAWVPGKIQGDAVSSFFMLPIIFALE